MDKEKLIRKYIKLKESQEKIRSKTPAAWPNKRKPLDIKIHLYEGIIRDLKSLEQLEEHENCNTCNSKTGNCSIHLGGKT